MNEALLQVQPLLTKRSDFEYVMLPQHWCDAGHYQQIAVLQLNLNICVCCIFGFEHKIPPGGSESIIASAPNLHDNPGHVPRQ